MPGCQFKRQACTVQACDEQAGLDTLPGLVPPCRWPRFHSCGLESPTQPATPTPARRGLERPVPGGPYSLLHPRPHQTLLNFSGHTDSSTTKQPLYGLSPCSQSTHPTSLSLPVDVKLGLPEHHPPWPPQACSPRSVRAYLHQPRPRFWERTRADNAQQFESKSSRAKGIAFHPKR